MALLHATASHGDKTLDQDYAFVFHIRDGQIAETWKPGPTDRRGMSSGPDSAEGWVPSKAGGRDSGYRGSKQDRLCLLGELSGRGEQVRALVRSGEPAAGVPAAAQVVAGDLADEGSLVRAMAGIEKVFLLSSPHPDAVRWHRNAIDAARRTEVRLLVRSSILGADGESPAQFVTAHTTCDRYLEDSGLPFVIVRPNLFLQNIPDSTIPSIDASGVFYLPAGDARISMVDTRDVAAVAAVVLTEPGTPVPTTT